MKRAHPSRKPSRRTSTALIRRSERAALRAMRHDPSVPMFERLARDKSVNPEKLERLIAMQERILKHQARAAFDSAFAEMQGDIPEIDEKGRIIITSEDGQPKGAPRPYAKNEDIQLALRPILKAHGFALSFRTEWPENGKIRIVGVLGHRDGHTKESTFEASADTSGKKNNIQAIGSTISYGHRYTTKDLLNITSRGEDTDGERPKEKAGRRDVTPSAGHNPASDKTITVGYKDVNGTKHPGQLERLWAIIKKSGRPEAEIKSWLERRFGYTSTKDIRRKDYDHICAAIESPATLPEKDLVVVPEVLSARDPGQEG
jgi:hypothetical protein